MFIKTYLNEKLDMELININSVQKQLVIDCLSEAANYVELNKCFNLLTPGVICDRCSSSVKGKRI